MSKDRKTEDGRRKTEPPRPPSGGFNLSAYKAGGTYEWADVTYNIQIGCEHDCRYCYARNAAVERFHTCQAGEWDKPVINSAKVNRDFSGYKNKIVMYPSSHDITELNIEASISVIKNLLAAGAKVLIVSKPHFSCIMRLCEELKDFKEKILFRFTIGSIYEKTLEFFEPGAPDFAERISCLQYAHRCGFETSISIEPYLDPYVCNLVEAVSDWVTETIWIGKMRKIKQRLKLEKVTDEQMKKFVEPMLLATDDSFIKLLYEILKKHPQVRWKDSIREVISELK